MYTVKKIHVDGEVKVGDELLSESFGAFPVKVTGFTEKGDYITDEMELADPFGGSYYVINKQAAIKLSEKLYLFEKGQNIAVISDSCTWLHHNDKVKKDDVRISERCQECYGTQGAQAWCGCSNVNIQYANIKGPCGHFH